MDKTPARKETMCKTALAAYESVGATGQRSMMPSGQRSGAELWQAQQLRQLELSTDWPSIQTCNATPAEMCWTISLTHFQFLQASPSPRPTGYHVLPFVAAGRVNTLVETTDAGCASAKQQLGRATRSNSGLNVQHLPHPFAHDSTRLL